MARRAGHGGIDAGPACRFPLGVSHSSVGIFCRGNGDVLADDADAAAENAEQDSDQNVSNEDTDDSGQDNSDVDENLEEELGTEDVDQSE